MKTKQTIDLLANLLSTQIAHLNGHHFDLQFNPAVNGFVLTSNNFNELDDLATEINLITASLAPQDMIANIVAIDYEKGPFQIMLKPAQLAQLGQCLGLADIDAFVSQAKTSFDPSKLFALSAAATQPWLNALNNIQQIHTVPDIVDDVAEQIDSCRKQLSDLETDMRKLKQKAASLNTPQDYDEFVTILNGLEIKANTIVRTQNSVNQLIAEENAQGNTPYLNFLTQLRNEFLNPLINDPELQAFFDLVRYDSEASQETQKCKAILAAYAVKESRASGLAHEQAAKNATLWAQIGSDPSTYIKNIIKSNDPDQAFHFVAGPNDKFYIKLNPSYSNNPDSIRLFFYYLTTVIKPNVANFGTLLPDNTIELSQAEATQLAAACGRLVLPSPQSLTTVKPLHSTSTPASTASTVTTGVFDLTLPANKTALEQAVQRQGLHWDDANSAAIRIFKRGDPVGNEIYLTQASASSPAALETTAKDHETYERMATLLDALRATPSNPAGVKGALLSNDANDVTELARLAKEMLDKGLGVQVDFTAKPANGAPAFDEARFKAALDNLDPTLSAKYESKKAELDAHAARRTAVI